MDDLSPSSPDRRQRFAARRGRRRRIAKIVTLSTLGVAAALVFGLVATDTIALRGEGPRLAGGSPVDDPTRVFGDAPEHVRDADALPPTRAISHDAPLRVWMGGDSHVGLVGRSLGDVLAATGVVAHHVDYRISSGLLGGPRDWIEHARTEVPAADPEVAIFMIGTNDATIWSSRDADEYRALATEMMDVLSDGGRRLVVWIGTPTLERDTWNESAVEINRIVSELAGERPEVLYVDAFDIFDDGAGGYTDSLPGFDGETVRMRNGDGTHFTEAGGEHLAAIVFALLDDIWKISDQADPDNPIAWTTASSSGCDGDCGYSGGSDDDYVDYSDDGADDGVVTDTTVAPPTSTAVTPSTTAPSTTAPPTTAPPTTAPSTTAPTTPPTSTPEPQADSIP